MSHRSGNILLVSLAVLLLVLLPVSLLTVERRPAATEPVQVFADYIKAAYARDFRRAYRFISSQDKRLKKEQIYVRERGAFAGFTLDVTRKLSEFVEFEPRHVQLEGDRARVNLKLRFPDADSLSGLLLDWNEEKLNALPKTEQKRILMMLAGLSRQNKMTMIEGEEESVLVKEGPAWRVLLDWASAVRVNFSAVVPDTGIIEAAPVSKETLIRPKEPFTIAYRVKNRTRRNIFARIVHRVEPKGLAQHLAMLECSLVLP
ncbi:MAG TPA: cytochrome c oxidase assembly protein, partial [Candidatus Binatia bacterium]|nr:cytochrome c oxidase assembly protein [Candidatus Binatia bacterium]